MIQPHSISGPPHYRSGKSQQEKCGPAVGDHSVRESRSPRKAWLRQSEWRAGECLSVVDSRRDVLAPDEWERIHRKRIDPPLSARQNASRRGSAGGPDQLAIDIILHRPGSRFAVEHGGVSNEVPAVQFEVGVKDYERVR